MKPARNMDATLKGRMKTLGLNIAYQRKRKELTQEELAEIIGCNPRYLSRVEACGPKDDIVPSLDFIYKVVDAVSMVTSLSARSSR